jgi:hypothetical protein
MDCGKAKKKMDVGSPAPSIAFSQKHPLDVPTLLSSSTPELTESFASRPMQQSKVVLIDSKPECSITIVMDTKNCKHHAQQQALHNRCTTASKLQPATQTQTLQNVQVRQSQHEDECPDRVCMKTSSHWVLCSSVLRSFVSLGQHCQHHWSWLSNRSRNEHSQKCAASQDILSLVWLHAHNISETVRSGKHVANHNSI